MPWMSTRSRADMLSGCDRHATCVWCLLSIHHPRQQTNRVTLCCTSQPHCKPCLLLASLQLLQILLAIVQLAPESCNMVLLHQQTNPSYVVCVPESSTASDSQLGNCGSWRDASAPEHTTPREAASLSAVMQSQACHGSSACLGSKITSGHHLGAYLGPKHCFAIPVVEDCTHITQ
jgi:hypothetical protein